MYRIEQNLGSDTGLGTSLSEKHNLIAMAIVYVNRV